MTFYPALATEFLKRYCLACPPPHPASCVLCFQKGGKIYIFIAEARRYTCPFIEHFNIISILVY